MKIAFLGTHGTGKTTLAHELVTKLKKRGIDTGFVSEVARGCPLPINESATKKSQIWIILNQIIKEIEAEEKYKVIVCDRSVLDGYCYYVNKFGRSSTLEPLVKEHLKTYKFLIRVPIREGLLQKDKVRSTNINFQKQVDKQFDFFLKEFKVKYQQMNNSNYTEEETIKNIINNLE